MPGCNTPEENAVVDRARRLLATYEDMAELIRLGAYRHGSDPGIDEAIHYMPALEAFLSQTGEEKAELQATYTTLAGILDMTGDGEVSSSDGSEG
jgi:flagellum-specific ATP synthase